MKYNEITDLSDLIKYCKQSNRNIKVVKENNMDLAYTIYSYDTPICVLVKVLKEGYIDYEGYVLVRWTYSRTTSNHRRVVIKALHDYVIIPYDYIDFTNLLKFYNLPLGELQ